MSLCHRVGDITELDVHGRTLRQMRQRDSALLLPVRAVAVVLYFGRQPVTVVAVRVDPAIAQVVLGAVKKSLDY